MSAVTDGARRISASLLCAVILAGCSQDDGYKTVDPRLKVVRVESDGDQSYLGLALDGMGRMFVGGKEALFVYEPKPDGLYRRRRELWRFAPDSWIFSIAVRGHDLYVLTASALYVFPDGVVKRQGLQPRKLLWGYPTIYCHTAFHGMTFGPDGDLYISMGDPVFYLTHISNMADHWGHWTFHHGPDDARMPYTGTGGVLRLSPDGRQLHVYAGGTHNDCGLAFDQQWNLFGPDNDHETNPEFIPARLLYIPEHAYFSWARGWMPEKEPWRSDLLQTMTADLGRCVPVGICYYNEAFLPAQYRDCLFVARWDNRTLPYFSRQRIGDTFKAEERAFLTGPNGGLARPISVCVGRGGRLFAILCYMEHNEESPAYRSHLLMITTADDPNDAPFVPFDETRASLDELFHELEAPSWDRQFRAHLELTRRGPEAFRAAAEKIKSLDPLSPAALHLIWLAAADGSPDTQGRILFLTRNPSPPVRLTALRAVARFGGGPAANEAFANALSDQDPQIRHAALIGEMDCGAQAPVERIAALAAGTLDDIVADGATGPLRTNWEEGSYIRQTAAFLLARRATVGQLSSLCQDSDPRMRLTGILGVGFRLTIPDPGDPIDRSVPVGSMLEDGLKRFSITGRPEDMRYIAAGSFFSTPSIWMAVTMTPDQQALNALLERGLHDANKNIARQSLFFLRLIRHRRSDADLASDWGMVQRPETPRAPIPMAKPASAAHLPPEFRKFDWEREAVSGNIAAGRQLFVTRGCNRCHSVEAGDGGSGGPSLAGAGSRFSFPYLAESVVAPNAVVLPEYRWTSFKLKNGDETDGLVTAETADTVEVLLPSAARQFVKKEDIVSRELQNHSPMPEGLIRTPEELRDLLAFLGSLRK
jgi:putative heme-binding domain-containing protein